MDWNWFFSTFAQCGAAIIGIIGAFIIAKMIDVTSRIHGSTNDITSLINECETIKDKVQKINIIEYNRIKIQYPQIRRSILQGEFDDKTDIEIYSILYYNFGLYLNDSNVIQNFNIHYGEWTKRK